MRILCTGGSGFIGSHIVDRVIEMGHEPVIVDDLSSGVDRTRKGVEFYRFTIGKDSCSAVASSCGSIIHAAAYAELRQNWTSPKERERLHQSNVVATLSLLEEMPRVPFVFLSTCSIYGAATMEGAVGECEAGPETIQSPYAASKLACEAYVAAYAHAHGFRWHAARLVNVVGTRAHRGVIGDFVKMARNDQHIHAADDGKQCKSWVHVSDVAEAVVDMATCSSVPSGVYNLTSKERISWWDVIADMNWPSERVTFEKRAGGAIGDPVDLHVSGAKLSPWFECERPVHDGIQDALKWFEWS